VIPRALPLTTAEEAVRLVRALGAHRYVAGRLVLVHAFAAAALDAPEAPPALDEAIAWARAVLADPTVDPASKDERLFRTASAEEVTSLLLGFWTPSPPADRAHERLMDRLDAVGLDVGAHAPFDEEFEDDVHPVLVDAGWELQPLAALDRDRHKGAIDAFGEPILFEAARFEEESAIPPLRYLQEFPVIGPVELLRGVDADGSLVEPLVLWTEGHEVYQDYVLRGALRAAKAAKPSP
jgi:hypothetical protein